MFVDVEAVLFISIEQLPADTVVVAMTVLALFTCIAEVVGMHHGCTVQYVLNAIDTAFVTYIRTSPSFTYLSS